MIKKHDHTCIKPRSHKLKSLITLQSLQEKPITAFIVTCRWSVSVQCDQINETNKCICNTVNPRFNGFWI